MLNSEHIKEKKTAQAGGKKSPLAVPVGDHRAQTQSTPSVPAQRHRFRYALAVALWIALLVTFSVTLYLVPPQTVISYIGISNAYLLIFVLSFLGGMMTFSGVPYHLFLVSFVLSGLNPYLLGAIAGIGVTIGDATSYLIGYFGRVLLSERMEKILQRLESLKDKHPRILPAIFFLYGACVPYSSDVITVPMGLIRYPFWKLMIPLGVGAMIFNITLSLLSAYAYEYLTLIF